MATQQQSLVASTHSATEGVLERTRVFELMQVNVATCSREDSLARAAELMWSNDCGSIPVVNHWYELIGIITDRDICMASYMQNARPAESQVMTAMAHQIWTCASDDTLAEALQNMRQHHVRRLPVVDVNRRLLGIITLADISAFIADRASGNTASREQAMLADTVAELCRPRTTPSSVPPSAQRTSH